MPGPILTSSLSLRVNADAYLRTAHSRVLRTRSTTHSENSEWRRPDLNRQPPGCKPGALPIELRPRKVGLSGFEPLTLRLSGVRSNQLSYRPIGI